MYRVYFDIFRCMCISVQCASIYDDICTFMYICIFLCVAEYDVYNIYIIYNMMYNVRICKVIKVQMILFCIPNFNQFDCIPILCIYNCKRLV